MNIGILGGTFNPVHIAHLRHAIEVGEALGLERVLLTPCATPPHKTSRGLLSFARRVEMVKKAVEGVRRLEVNTIEGEMDGPSYTFDSLSEWRRRNLGVKPYFLLGVEDFAALPTWKRGLDLPQIAHLVVVPRAGSDWALFFQTVQRLWPGSHVNTTEGQTTTEGQVCVTLANGGECSFLPLPRLDISASAVRERWLAGRDIHALVPEGVRQLLDKHREEVTQTWRELLPE